MRILAGDISSTTSDISGEDHNGWNAFSHGLDPIMTWDAMHTNGYNLDERKSDACPRRSRPIRTGSDSQASVRSPRGGSTGLGSPEPTRPTFRTTHLIATNHLFVAVSIVVRLVGSFGQI
jgi:hypothetical protein